MSGKMSRKGELEPVARNLRAGGMTYEAIAAHFADLNPPIEISERQLRRWARSSGWGGATTEDWPSDRTWPRDWTVDSLENLPGYDRSAWEGNATIIRTAEAQGNRRLPWFFRRLVDLGHRNTDWPSDDEALEWAVAIAGLPVLGEWLGCGESADTLADLIEQHRPWNEGGIFRRKDSPRGIYEEAAKEAANALRQSLFTAQAMSTQLALGTSGDSLAVVLLAALCERVPMFGRRPRVSLRGRLRMGSIMLGLLSLPDDAVSVIQ